MKLMNWKTIYREPKTTICNPEHKKYPYLLKNLKITYKNQVWATDITYIPMNKGFMYLTAIIDLHTRYVLNWDISNTMSAEWCTKVLNETIEKHGAPLLARASRSCLQTETQKKNGYERDALTS